MSIVVSADGVGIRMERAEEYRSVEAEVELDVLAVGVGSMRLVVGCRRAVLLECWERISLLAGTRCVEAAVMGYGEVQEPRRRTGLEVVLDDMNATSRLLAEEERVVS